MALLGIVLTEENPRNWKVFWFTVIWESFYTRFGGLHPRLVCGYSEQLRTARRRGVNNIVVTPCGGTLNSLLKIVLKTLRKDLQRAESTKLELSRKASLSVDCPFAPND